MSEDKAPRPNLDTLQMAVRLRLEEEKGGHVRDIEANIFPQPKRSFNADYEGDTFYHLELPKPRLPLGELGRRTFNNMSLTRKNSVRKIQKKLNAVAKLHDKK